MKPDTNTMEAAAPGAAPLSFDFDGEGVCLNPERIEIPCPTGLQCALLVAKTPEGQWAYGVLASAKGKPLVRHQASLKNDPCVTRKDAIEWALVFALEAVEPEHPLTKVLERWRAIDGGVSIEQADKAFPMEEPPAFGGSNTGRVVEFASREDAQAYIDQERTRAGFADYHVRIESRRKRSGTLFDVVYIRGSAAETPADDDVSEASAPAAESAATVGELIAHQWSEDGICLTPECVEVPDMPKGCRISIQLGLAPDGLWRLATTCQSAKVARVGNVAMDTLGFAERGAAVIAGLKATALHFENSKKATAAIEAFYDTLKAGLPANTVAEVEAPAAAPRERVVYKTEFAEVAVAKIQANPANHRKHFDSIELRELADSLLTEGLHQPIGVRKLLDGEAPAGELGIGDAGAPEFELIYGERRWRAAQIAPLATLQAKIYHGLRREQCHAIALIENLQRAGINAMEEAHGFDELMKAEGLTQEAAALRVGKERSTVANVLGLLTLPAKVQGWIGSGELTKAHGIALKRFVPDVKKGEDKDFPKWEMVIGIMAEEAVERKAPAGSLEKGVPSVYKLTQAGLALRIHQFGMGSYDIKLPAAFKMHPAYFATGDGDWICMNPPHWTAYVDEQERLAKEKAVAEKAKREAEIAKAAKQGKKQVSLGDLDREAYRRIDEKADPAEAAALDRLVPVDKRATAKEGTRNVSIVTDTQLADRISAAMVRVIKKNRRAAVPLLLEKVTKKINALKKVGPREWAWLVHMLTDYSAGHVRLHLTAAAAKAVGVKIPKAVRDDDLCGDRCDGDKRLSALAAMEPVDLVKVLMAERVDAALEDLVESGPGCVGAEFVRWWLDTDTLWLLEETEEGREELVDEVKNAPWYAKAVAGEPAGEDEK